MSDTTEVTLSEAKPETIQPKITEVLPERKPNEYQDQILGMVSTAGTIQLTEDQKSILYSPVNIADVEIRPDGLIYLPWMEYVSRLRDTFGLGWAIIPQGMPKMQGNALFWPFYLVIQGKLAGFAIGEQAYQPSNARMTYGDAVEGAKSNALMRLCKGIGISLELWKPSFVRDWKEKHAEEYFDEVKKKKLWRKKSTEGKTTSNFEFLKIMKKEKERVGNDVYYGVLKDFKVEHANQIKTTAEQLKIYNVLTVLHKETKEKNE